MEGLLHSLIIYRAILLDMQIDLYKLHTYDSYSDQRQSTIVRWNLDRLSQDRSWGFGDGFIGLFLKLNFHLGTLSRMTLIISRSDCMIYKTSFKNGSGLGTYSHLFLHARNPLPGEQTKIQGTPRSVQAQAQDRSEYRVGGEGIWVERIYMEVF